MKNLILVFIIVLITIVSFNKPSITQESQKFTFHKKNPKPDKKSLLLNKTFPLPNIQSRQKTNSDHENRLLLELKSARKSGNKNEMQRLRNEINNLQGIVTKYNSAGNGFRKPVKKNLQSDNIILSQISTEQNIRSTATATEQRGANTGRIWVIVASIFGKNSYSYFEIYYSDDKGINWTNYAVAENPYEIIEPDAMDAEIIEDVTGTKYLHFVYGAMTVSSGKKICILSSLNISGTIEGTNQRLEWPAFDYDNTDVNYYKPRITTDNAFWEGGAYAYIIASQDSSYTGGNAFSEKAAALFDPYSSNPSVSYKPYYFFYYSTMQPAGSGYSDIAWLDDPSNGGGSVMMSESGAFFNQAIYLYEAADVDYLNSAIYLGYLDPDGIEKANANVSSNGLYQNVMIVNRSVYDPDDNDAQYFSSTNAGANWTTDFLNYTYDSDGRIDIAGRRNSPGTFISCFANVTNFFTSDQNVFECNASTNNWGMLKSPLNHLLVNPDPIAGIKLNSSDSCFAIWKEYTGYGVWASNSCSGALQPIKFINFSAFFEGYYDSGTYEMVRGDTVKVSLRKSYPPYTEVEGNKVYLPYYGFTRISFVNADDTTDYYVVLNTRNTIETWYAYAFEFGGSNGPYTDFLYYDNSYGPNQKYLGTDPDFYDRYGMYSGDCNQDESIDVGDIIDVYNDVNNVATGYVPTDITGDDFVDVSDLLLTYNNATAVISVVRP